jgi:hypothetical protein
LEKFSSLPGTAGGRVSDQELNNVRDFWMQRVVTRGSSRATSYTLETM